MKKSFFAFLTLFVISVFFASDLFAENIPIPGVDVVAKRCPTCPNPDWKPGLVTVHTGKNGEFSCQLPTGDYELVISYSQVAKALSPIKNWDGNGVTLTYSNSDIKTLVPLKVTVTKNSEHINITVHSKSATISGTLTYEAKSAQELKRTGYPDKK